MESSISRDDSRIDGQKMAEAVNAKYRKKKLVVGILILLFIAAIYLNVGYLIAGDIERACKNMGMAYICFAAEKKWQCGNGD